MIRTLTFITLITIALISIVLLIMQSTGVTTITLNQWSVEMKTSTLLLTFLILFFGFNILLGLLRYIFGLRTRLKKMREKHLSTKASKELIQGLLLVAEGHWNKAEKILLKNAEYSETPVINYLAAARASHLQGEHDHRDELLKQAAELDNSADIVISVSQAEMQLDAKQVSQAQATLLRLQDLSPNHPYIGKLLAKVYFKQKNWTALFELMPALLKQKVLKGDDAIKLKTAAIKGLFEKYAAEGNTEEIQKSWKKLPNEIRKHPDAVLLYADSLSTAGNQQVAGDILASTIDNEWNDELVELYGKIEHDNPVTAGEKATKWLDNHPDSPTLLLTLARLNLQKKLWGKAKSFYENSLNMKPNTVAYLELSELLAQLGEKENANTCYRIGLQYCIGKKVERLNLKSDNKAGKTEVIQTIDDEDEFYTV